MLTEKLRLYVILPDSKNAPALAEKALQGGATTVQLRMKGTGDRECLQIARKVRGLTREYDALFIVDDRVDVALLSDADGVHLGAEDLPVKDVRELAPNLIIGATVRSVESAKSAEKEGADYLGVGSIYPSPSKDAPVIGVQTLKELASSVNIPVVAIGGITEKNVAEVIAAGAAGVAVLSAIFSSENVREKTTLLRRSVDSALARRGT
ncbi:MAG: thiamine phosphate synthase [Euryarchaeota archaeon]|nr:thiamine phosphate synthase [Euryarchaeota archaeon]